MEKMEQDDVEKKRKERMLDDVPIALKRTKFQEEPAGVEQLAELTMHATTVPEGKSEWFNKHQTGGLGILMNKVIKGVKIHSQPTKAI